jgi:hypothetical protein
VWLLVVSAALVAEWAANAPVYFTNDDVTIRLALEGRAVPGEPPTGFSLLTHAALGWTVVGLNATLPEVPWWDLLIAATLACALAVLLAMAWQALGPGWLARSAGIGTLLVAIVPLASGLQFTISAMLAGAAAAVLALTEACSRRPRASVLAASACLLLVGLLVRTMAAAASVVAVTLFMSPLVLAGALRNRRLLTLLAAAAALIVGVQLTDILLYAASGEWNDYYGYNWMAARLFEWGGELPSDQATLVRESVGWSANDWMMLQAFFGVDRAVHGFDHVARAFETRASFAGWLDLAGDAVTRAVRMGSAEWLRLLQESLGVLVAIAAAGIYSHRRGAMRLAATGLLFCGMCLAVEAVFKELPFRVLAPLQVCLAAAVLIVIGASRREPAASASVVALAVILAVLGPRVVETVVAAAAESRHSQQVREEVGALTRLTPSLLVLHADTFPREHWWRPFRQPPVELPAIALGWNNQSPQLQHYLVSTGREPLLQAICRDPAILIVAEEGRLDFVTTYLRQRYDMDVRWMQVFVGSFRAWRCVPS